MSSRPEVDQLLDAAEKLFYERGYQSVGMDALRSASGMPLKRIYSLFKGKDAIAVAMLDRRDDRWHALLARRVDRETQSESRVLAIFDWLASWLAGEGHRGCAWINAFGELGTSSPDVADAVRRHKTRLRKYVNEVVTEAGASLSVADGVFLLIEGCMVTAGISGNADAAVQAKGVAARLLIAQLRFATNSLLVNGPIRRAENSAAREHRSLYLTAFHAIDAGPAQLLVTAVDKTGTVLATMQLTVIPGLVRSGATRLIVDAVRVHERLRGNELGSEMMNRTVAEGRRRNGALVQLTSDKVREDTHRFYEYLGFTPSRTRFKLAL